jgi:hypothetical protein
MASSFLVTVVGRRHVSPLRPPHPRKLIGAGTARCVTTHGISRQFYPDPRGYESLRKEVIPVADFWTAREGVTLGDELVGYDVEGRGGRIGKVDHVTYERTCVVVSTSRLFGGKQYVIPANSLERVDMEGRTIFVDLSKDEVENSPEYDDHLGFDEDCEAKTGTYYADVLARRGSVR